MGYTHYFPQNREVTSAEWSQIVDLFGKIMKASKVPLRHEFNEPGTEPEVTSDVIWFNGVGDGGHEVMVLHRVVLQRGGSSFACCDTKRKPYDVVVAALLAVAAHVAPDAWEVKSDGDEHEDEWQNALRVASEAAGRMIEYPVDRTREKPAEAESPFHLVTPSPVPPRYVVRVALTEEQVEDQMIKGTVDFMAHAEFIKIHEDVEDETGAALLFDIRPPAHIADEDTQAWAEKVTEGMVANHYNAEVAPPWRVKFDD